MPRIVVDGLSHTVGQDLSLVEALNAVGIRLPALCHDSRLKPTGACRLCLVRVKGSAHPVPACATPLADGLDLEVSSPELEEARSGALKLLAWRYPADAVTAFPEKPFHTAIRERGLADALAVASNPDSIDRSHPYIAVDMTRCIDCYRCVRICDEVQGQFVWHVRNRGFDTTIRPDGPSLRDSSCVSCGACVDTCPTGALEDASVWALGLATTWTRTTCPYCGTGCEMAVGTREDRIVAVKPVMDAPVSKGHLCVKGRYAFEFVRADDRVTDPMIRSHGKWQRVAWDEALRFAASRLQDLIDRHGPNCIGVLGSARATNEEAYLTQKFARLVIGTNNVDCCARVCHTPSSAALKAVLGAGLSTNSFDDIEIAQTILLCGANATENHPVVGARIKQAARRGATLIVIDPRRIELASYADCHLAVRPGTNVPLLNAMAHVITTERLYDRAFVEARVADFQEFSRFVEGWPPERAAAICGVEAETIRRAARLYAAGPPAIIFNGLGMTEHVQGTDGVMALVNLALLTGNIGKPGAGVNPLRGQNNVQGAAHMGCEPSTLPGSMPLASERQAYERLWHAPIPHARGLHQMEMMDAAIAGQLKALWTIGYDVLLTNANSAHTARALGALELVIVQDLFLNETAREFGTVFLPACSSFEKEGTFMNAERRIQRVRKMLEPVGLSKPDWQIISELALAMGRPEGFQFSDPVDIWNEVRSACRDARGMTYDRLDHAGLQWPCPADDHPGTAILHRGSFSIGHRAALRSIEYQPSPETMTADYPFLLTTGRTLYQFNAGTMTMRTLNATLRSVDLLDISPEDAAELGLHDGLSVRLVSRHGATTIAVRLSPAMRRGQLFATFHTVATFLNRVTSPHRDRVVGSPEYKLVAVRLEPVALLTQPSV